MKAVKIGVASGESSVDRMFQVNRDYFMKYRTCFSCKISRDRVVPADECFKMESILHKFFSNYNYTPKIKFDGSTELFTIPIEDAIQAYELVIEGVEPDFVYQMPSTKEAEDSLPF